ncbi:MAG: DNA polymerase III subunit gamma/tau [Bacilli bacterium]|nr:DNA polymerase III subunit gamma/tau [Bacilli bacterium]
MSYKALYLTYRPQTFEEVAGQKPIVRTLKNALTTGKMAHAYLFAGPRGTGKTSMARLFAKALNCEEGLGHQCNHCQNCQEVANGTHPDVIEIDAASNNGVDQVRDLIEKVRYAPIKGNYKVYIIDEVHMMTTGAFNALLKTIEEPPENVIFILCTTEPFKVIPTILSRCQRFDFSKLSPEEMSEKLHEILGKEGTKYTEEGLKTIIDLADGGMRDALSILDQVLAFSNNVLHEEDVLAMYGLASIDEKVDLILSIREGNVAEVVKKSEAYLAGGIDIRRLVLELISLLKDLLIYEKTNDVSLMEKLDKENADVLAKNLSPADCNSMISSLIEAQNNFRNVSDIRSLFELTLLRMASTDTAAIAPAPKPVKKPAPAPKPVEPKPEPVQEAKPVEETPSTPLFEFINENKYSPAPKKNAEVPDWLIDKEEPKEEAAPAPAPAPAPMPKKEPKPVKEDTIVRATTIDTSKIAHHEISNSGTNFVLSDEQIFNISILASKEERLSLKDKWPLLDELKMDPKFGKVASLLSDSSPFCLCKEALILAYQHKNQAEKANLVANQAALSDLVEAMLGRRVFVYALDPNRRLAVRTYYYEKVQMGQIPNKKDIVLDLPIVK